jgi:hypothetical protein
MLNWNFRNPVWLGLICCLAIWVTAFSVDVQAQEPTETSGGAGGQLDTKWIVITIAVLLLIVIGVIGCLFLLQNRILSSDLDKEKMEMLMEYPFGVPAGTVRSLLALLIVTISLLFIVLQIFVEKFSFPPALTAVLGTVLGFYFGSRSSSKGEQALSKQVKQIQTDQSRELWNETKLLRNENRRLQSEIKQMQSENRQFQTEIPARRGNFSKRYRRASV